MYNKNKLTITEKNVLKNAIHSVGWGAVTFSAFCKIE
jgi:hypothetical protein